jgi:hypothetical protein
VVAAVAGGAYEVDHRVLRPAAHVASGPVPPAYVRPSQRPPYQPPGPTTTTSPTTTSPTTTTVPPVHPSGSAPRARVAAQLTALIGGASHCLVQVPGGWDAATYDETGDIRLWTWRSGTWARVAQRRYPAPADSGPVTVDGVLLDGMEDATFALTGPLGPSRSDATVAYAAGPEGWGAVVPTATGQLASDGGDLPTYAGLPDGVDHFVDGQLETVNVPDVLSTPVDAAFPVIRQWAWTGRAFAQTGSDIVNAAEVATPDRAAPPLPAGSAQSGTYAAQLLGVTEVGTSTYPLLRLDLEAGTLARCRGYGYRNCFTPDGAGVPLVVSSTTPTVFAARSGAALISVTGPAWGLAVPGGLCCSVAGHDLASSLGRYGAAGWWVPPSLGVTSFVDTATPILEVTAAGGEVTGLSEPAGI